ncbi:bifunctional diaminohydroxyphosphoribosylaminopyrimidine deaminase/5-amino-6-(5-phosphoribosylamino)uracil reductase RibD [Paenibacillus sp. 481]|nr:bifunctional diaminohydroxyphosphoribosylaminopyrimidine deaminase/5-amino-6-(5-phosphoribosylamino)uracil reductase RibD [Paenibacillus sp. 481]
MQLALDLASRVVGQTGVNPAVGCVLVNEGRIVGMGAHLKRGDEHAEIHALRMAAQQACGATAYVTLEPCSHHGRTPPCSLRLVEAGVKRVVIACTDPNPLVSGRGMSLLRTHSIEVEEGILEQQGKGIIEPFAKYITTGLPFVTLKTASTLDGKIATKSGDSRWITNSESRERVHALRHRHQAIMVGIGTVLADDPALTTRLNVPGLHPIRLIVDSQLRLPLHAQIVIDNKAPTWVMTTESADKQRAAALQQRGVEIIRAGDGKQVDLQAALRECSRREIGSILLEGGGRLNGAMLTAGLIDKIALFFAPKIVGGTAAPSSFEFDGVEQMREAFELRDVHVETISNDVCVFGYPVKK